MKVLVTGSEGYIGSVMMPFLIANGVDVVGMDACFYEEGHFCRTPAKSYPLIRKDIRHACVQDFYGVDAVIHLAALCNDPLGSMNADLTFDINFRGTVDLAAAAKCAGVRRFLFSSSCALYGASESVSTEESPFNPQTPYGKSKQLAEEGLRSLASDSFCPTFLRNSTAYGLSPRMRFDLVVNSLAGYAHTVGEIRIEGDGTPWRPIVHVSDICRAFLAVLRKNPDTVYNQAFNVGCDMENYQIATIAKHVQAHYPDCNVTIAQTRSDDTRNYRVGFRKMENVLGIETDVELSEGVRTLRRAYSSAKLDRSAFDSRLYNRLKQIRHLKSEGRLDDFLMWKEKR